MKVRGHMASAEREPIRGSGGEFVSISGATSSKSGVDMSTPVYPVATPMPITGVWGRNLVRRSGPVLRP